MQKKHIPAHAKEILKISRKKVIISTIAVVLSLCALTTGVLVAKYVNEKNSDRWVRAKNFYFTSNLLDGKEHTLAPGSTSVTFTLGNHEDNLRYSEVDIKYTVTVTEKDATTTLATVTDDKGTDTGTNAYSGTLANGSVKDAEITVSNLQDGKKYTITAVGTGGYKKTLTTTIVVPPKAAQLYYNIDNSAGEYTLLTVWNEGDKEGKVTITYTGIPDNTNPDMTNWNTGEAGSELTPDEVAIGPHESKVFRFFGETSITVTNAEPKELY